MGAPSTANSGYSTELSPMWNTRLRLQIPRVARSGTTSTRRGSLRASRTLPPSKESKQTAGGRVIAPYLAWLIPISPRRGACTTGVIFAVSSGYRACLSQEHRGRVERSLLVELPKDGPTSGAVEFKRGSFLQR